MSTWIQTVELVMEKCLSVSLPIYCWNRLKIHLFDCDKEKKEEKKRLQPFGKGHTKSKQQ